MTDHRLLRAAEAAEARSDYERQVVARAELAERMADEKIAELAEDLADLRAENARLTKERDEAIACAEKAQAERDAALAVKSIADAPAALQALFGDLTDALLDIPSDGPEAMFIEADSARMQAEAERDALKAENARLRALISEAREALTNVRGCFEAASFEGLHERLAEEPNKDVGSLHDLVMRRLMCADIYVRAALARLKETTDAAE